MDLKNIEQYFELIRPFGRDMLFIARDMLMRQLKDGLRSSSPDNLILDGYSVYSQNEEDGILNSIFGNLGISSVTFFEFGVHATENNTLHLLQKKGRGIWFDKSLTDFREKLGPKKNLLIIDEFVTLSNIEALCRRGLEFLGMNGPELDLLSLDLDGNDYYLIERILQTGIMPKLFCLEYNAKFPLPLSVRIGYKEDHRWTGDDYQGCSLQAYIDLLKDKYTLLVCNLSGSNCFFIRNDLRHKFVIYDPAILYMPCRYYLSPFNKGHSSSTKYLELID